MVSSSKAKKQRKARYNAPMHIRQHYAHVHLAKELKSKLGISTRSMQLRRGDTVKVMSGGSKGKTGKVVRVSLRKSIAHIEGITRKNARGKESFVPISISNLYVTDLDMTDKLRSAKIEMRKKEVKK